VHAFNRQFILFSASVQVQDGEREADIGKEKMNVGEHNGLMCNTRLS
jgi:hypothetical protein